MVYKDIKSFNNQALIKYQNANQHSMLSSGPKIISHYGAKCGPKARVRPWWLKPQLWRFAIRTNPTNGVGCYSLLLLDWSGLVKNLTEVLIGAEIKEPSGSYPD